MLPAQKAVVDGRTGQVFEVRRIDRVPAGRARQARDCPHACLQGRREVVLIARRRLVRPRRDTLSVCWAGDRRQVALQREGCVIRQPQDFTSPGIGVPAQRDRPGELVLPLLPGPADDLTLGVGTVEVVNVIGGHR